MEMNQLGFFLSFLSFFRYLNTDNPNRRKHPTGKSVILHRKEKMGGIN